MFAVLIQSDINLRKKGGAGGENTKQQVISDFQENKQLSDRKWIKERIY